MNGLIMCSIFKLEGNEGTPLLVFLIHIPLLYIMKRLNSDISSKECAKLSQYLKITIINGILIILISAK